MKSKLKYSVTAFVMAAFFLGLSLFAWFKPMDDFSDSERRKLSKFPELSVKTVLSGDFMGNFENYTLDQFPSRDKFRTVKALAELNLFNKGENNGIYEVDSYVSKLEYPYNEASVVRAANRFRYVYEKYLKDTGTTQYLTVIPDKNFFMAEENGYLSMDYEKMVSVIRENTDFLTYIDIIDELTIEDYYKTDTHWKQENLTHIAEKICGEMGVDVSAEYEVMTLDKDFYGVYYGQSALPLEGEPLQYLTNESLENCRVYDYQNSKSVAVYDMEKAYGKDPYEIFLSGPISLITVENDNAKTDKELVVFRDSFGSSIAPLFAEGYKKITLVDIRYIHPDMLQNYIEFNNQDVLFMYSTMVLNNSETIRVGQVYSNQP